MEAKKVSEGREHVRLAEKSLKTSFFKWNADHDSAGDEYSKAAMAFKLAKSYQESLDAFQKACECYKQINSLYQAAKCLDNAVLVARDSGELDLVKNFAERGSLMYRQHGSNEAAIQLLEKAAQMLETNSRYDSALDLYLKSLETLENDQDKHRLAAEVSIKIARLNVKDGASMNYDQSIAFLLKAINLFQSCSNASSGRLVIALILCHLAKDQGDAIGAAKAFSDYGGFCDPDEASCIQEILSAIDQEDGPATKRSLENHLIRNLHVEFAKLAPNIKLPQEGGLENAAQEMAAAVAFSKTNK